MDGLRLLGRGNEADVFEWSATEVLKLWRDPSATKRADQELAGLRYATQLGVRAPKPLERIDRDGRPGLVMERLSGQELAQRLARRPWKLREAGALLASLHAALHSKQAPRLPSVRDRIAVVLAGSDLVTDAKATALAILARLPEDDGLCHGNLHLANVYLTPEGPALLDWADAGHGSPESEVALTLVRYLVARSRSSPQVPARIDHIAGQILRRRYLSGYRRLHPINDELLQAWVLLRLAERMAEGRASEAGILKLAWRSRRATFPHPNYPG